MPKPKHQQLPSPPPRQKNLQNSTMWSDEESVVVRPGFNQPVELGLLYDTSRDTLVCCEGKYVALWNAEDIDGHTEVLKKPRVQFGCMINNSLATERELLSVTGGVGVGDPVGLIKVSVSGTYTKEKWCADDKAEFKVYRSSELDFKHLDLTGLSISDLPAVNAVSDEASHVVLGIQYASNIVVTFHKTVRQHQERTKCELELKLTVLWIFSVSTTITLYSNQINEYSEHISCSVKLDDAPAKPCSIKEAIEVLKQGTRRTSPKYVMLYPLRKLFGKTFKTKPVVPLSDTLSNRIIEFFDNMFKLSTSAQNAVWRANIQHSPLTNQLLSPLLHFCEAVWRRVTVVRDELEEIIPQIRLTNRSETDALRILECQSNFNNWVTSKLIEMKLVQKGLTELESRCEMHNASVRKFLEVKSCEGQPSDDNQRQEGYDKERQQEEANQCQQKDQGKQVDEQRLLSNSKNWQEENENKVHPGGDLGQYDHSAVCRLYHRDQEDPNLAMLRDGDMKAMIPQTRLKTSFIALTSIRACIHELSTYLTHIADSTCHFAVESLRSTDVPMITLTCQELPVRIVRSLVNSNTKEAEQTTLECEVSRLNQQATWLHDGEAIQTTARVSASVDGAKHKLTISDTRLEDRGMYSIECGSAKTYCTLNVEELPVRIIRPLISQVIKECEQTVLECLVSKSNQPATWLKNGEPIESTDRVWYSVDGKTHSLKITDARIQDHGMYAMICGSAETSTTLTVEELPVIVIHPLVDSKTEEGEHTTLECEISKVDQQATWLHGVEEIQATRRVSASVDGVKHALTISHTCLEDGGLYTLKCGSARTYCTLSVEEIRADLLIPLRDKKVLENESVTLMCYISRGTKKSRWTKNGQELVTSDKASIAVKDLQQTLHIPRTELEHSGVYVLEVQGRAMDSCQLIVYPESELNHLEELVADCERIARTLLDNIADWIRARERAIGNMNDIANKLDKLQKDCDIAKTTGTSVAVVAGIFSVVLPFLIPVAVAGGVTAGGAAIAHTSISSSEIEQARTLLTRDRDLSELVAKGYSVLRDRSQEIVRLLATSRHLCYYLGLNEDHEWESAEQFVSALLQMVGADFPRFCIRHMTSLMRGPLSARGCTGWVVPQGIRGLFQSGVAGVILGAALGPLGTALQLVGSVGSLSSGSVHEHSSNLRQTSSEMNASLKPTKEFWEFLERLKNEKKALVHIVMPNRVAPSGFLAGLSKMLNESRVTRFIGQFLPRTLPLWGEVEHFQTKMEVLCEIFKRITEEIDQKDASISGMLRKITHIDIVLLGHGHIEYGECMLETACVTNIYTYQPWGCALDGSAAMAIIQDVLTPESRTYSHRETYGALHGVSDRVRPTWNDLVSTVPPVRIFLGKRQAPGDEARSALGAAHQALNRDKTFSRIVIPCYDTPPLPLEIYTAALSLSCFLHGVTCTAHVAASLEDPLALKSTGLRSTSEQQQIKRDCEENYCYLDPHDDNGRRHPVTMKSPVLVGDQKLRDHIDAILQD